MTERTFRIILGIALMALLYLNQPLFVYTFIGILIFEGITNLRIPIIVSKARYGNNFSPAEKGQDSKIPFDAERALRLIVAVFLILSYYLFPEALWFFPWFIGFMLLLAGIINICPMVMTLKWIGFR